MYILTATEIAEGSGGIQGANGTPCGTPPQSQFNSLQDVIRSRVEAALEIGSLRRYECQDTFEVSGRYSEMRRLRLTNGFVQSVSFLDAAGEPLIDTPATHFDGYYGIVTHPLSAGVVTVQYVSGFLADSSKVFQDLPDWVKPIALNVMFLWLRSMNRGAAIKDISQASLTAGMIRELTARVGNRYQRPRVGCIFPTTHKHRLISDPVSEWKQW